MAEPTVQPSSASARASRLPGTDGCEIALSGAWHLTEPRPAWNEVIGTEKPAKVRPTPRDLGAWDSSLLLFLLDARTWCQARGSTFESDALPATMRALLDGLAEAQIQGPPRARGAGWLARLGLGSERLLERGGDILRFVGDSALGLGRLLRQPLRFRWGDCLEQMELCGAHALGIVSLISFLVGLTLAYQAAVELRRFGGDIYVADLVGLSVVREMGPMMAAVILAGRTGAAFAATLGNMQANEEIDAFRTFGISVTDFLVLPRVLALAVMLPLLALYADALGILGGMFVADGILQIPPTAYWVETQNAIDFSDLSSGLIKAAAFGLLIGLAGCLRGLQAERSAAGVGRAATSAVVTSILLLIVADAVFAVLFNTLGF